MLEPPESSNTTDISGNEREVEIDPFRKFGPSARRRGREEKFDSLLRALQDACTSGLALRVTIEGAPGMGRRAFASECLRQANGLGLQTQGPVRCAGRKYSSAGQSSLCPVCRSGGPWSRTSTAAAPFLTLPAAPDVGACLASGRVWLRVSPMSADFRPHPRERIHRVHLGPLTHASVLQMSEDILGVPPGAYLASYLERTGGHPALVRELLLGLLEEQSLFRWEGVAHMRTDRLPKRVHTWVDETLGSAGLPVSEFLSACALSGDEFESLEPIISATGINREQCFEISRTASELGFLNVGESFFFKSSIIHEILWSNIPRKFPSFMRKRALLSSPHQTHTPPKRENNLTSQEMRIIRLTSEGFTNRQISHRLRISQHTVNYHLKKLFKKYNVNSRIRLVRTALKNTGFDHDKAITR